MTGRLAHRNRKRFPPCAVVLAVLLLPPLADAAGQPEADIACPHLPSEPRVSYKGNEKQLFRRVVDLVKRSPVIHPSASDVVQIFDACLDRLQKDIKARRDAVVQLRLDVHAGGAMLEISYGASQPRKYRTSNNIVSVASRVTRHLVGLVQPERRDKLGNQIWFLWIESYLRATGSRFNSFDYASDLLEERAQDRGRSFTVGFEVEVVAGRTRVSEVRDARLHTAGLAPGDELIGFDGRKLGEITVPELQNYWLSPQPFTFSIVAQRGDEVFAIAGESVPKRHSTVAWSIRGELGYVRIREFNRGSLIELRRALRSLEASQVKRLLIDLRGNRGGMLSTGLVDVFCKPGQTVVSYLDHEDHEAVDVGATVEYWRAPVAVLVDRDTASMAETLTAAFRTHELGHIVGERTRGKGVGQTMYPVLDEGRLHLVERTYYYPGTRETWNDIGIAPTLEIEVSEENRERVKQHIDSHVLRLDEQWAVDPMFRAAEKQLREQP